jgi:hypothetical protein
MSDLSNELHAIAARLQLRIGEALESGARKKVSASKTKGEDGDPRAAHPERSEMPDMVFLSELNV